MPAVSIVVRLLLAVVFLGSVGSFASGQDAESQQPEQLNPFGFDFTRFLFQQAGVEFADWRTSRQNPSESVLVLLGDVKDDHDPHVRDFVSKGGAILIATDRGVLGNIIDMSRGPVRVRDPNEWYQGYDDCFRVPVDSHEVTKGVQELVVNRAGTIRPPRRLRWKILGRTPDGQPVAAAFQQGEGRVIALSDHSPFTNGMLMHGDNAAFTLNVIDWLTDSGRRKRISFIVDGNTLGAPNMDPQIPDELPAFDPADIPQDTMLSIMNHFLRELDRENMINEWLAGIRPSHVWRWLLLIPSIIAAFIIARRLLTSEKMGVKPPAQNPSNASEARAADMLQTGSLRPVAIELARQFLRNLTGSVDPSGWAIRDRDVVIASEIGGSRRIKADVARMSQLAIGADRRLFKARDLRRLAIRVEFLNELLQSEQLRLRRPEGQLEFAT